MKKKPVLLQRGPVMVDVEGLALTGRECERLCHPLVGGVVLFARNFADSKQLAALTGEIHALRSPALLIAVDHEGGRVQRFRTDAFSRLPAMRSLGRLWQGDPATAHEAAYSTGYMLATELLAHAVDLSFTPVLDLDYGVSRAIGNRSLHADPLVVAALASALIDGLAAAGMGAVGKHFPGHGFVEADSHHEIPVDGRDFESIWSEDIRPYMALQSKLTGIMPAHVVYPSVAPESAGFSRVWLQQILRGRLGFKGIVFSDDLNMLGAMGAGDIVGRVEAAHKAGCDMPLVCNRPDLADDLLARWQPEMSDASRRRIAALRDAGSTSDVRTLSDNETYLRAKTLVAGIVDDDAPVMTAGTIGNAG